MARNRKLDEIDEMLSRRTDDRDTREAMREIERTLRELERIANGPDSGYADRRAAMVDIDTLKRWLRQRCG